MNQPSDTPGIQEKEPGARLVRHLFFDRFLHWFVAVCIFVLLGTSLFPIYGIKFSWVQTHWVTGLLLSAAVIIHVVRSVFWKEPRYMWFGTTDVIEIIDSIRKDLSRSGIVVRTGKYSPAQKLLHHGMTIIILTAIVTGLMMMVKVDTPFWERNPYWLSESTWGIVYVFHGFSALFSITMIIIHMYFGSRPEKRIYTRSMLLGWYLNDDYKRFHDPERWKITESGER